MENEKLTRDLYFNELRKKEFARLDESNHVYLDYTGGNIHPRSLVADHFQFLQNAVYGNPHSSNPASMLSGKFAAEAREKVCSFFNAADYYCVFTNNATGALQIAGECYPFSRESHLLLTTDNHNSVNGMREYSRNKGGGYSYSPMNEQDLSIDGDELNRLLHCHSGKENKLFAFPAQSNVSGVQHPLQWVNTAQELGWDVLLDAAAFVPSNQLDLSTVQPDFVSLSFYKIFGYPTGIGCLLIKKSTFNKLKKPSFAGGTITLSAVRYRDYFLKQDHEKFENGTINYLNIPAITKGLQFIETIGLKNINARIKDLGGLILSSFAALKHDNGMPLIKLYGTKNMEDRGGTFLVNFYDANGLLYPFQYIEQLANARNISLRTGCFCNPGIDEINHRLSAAQLENYFASRNQGDYEGLISYLGRMRGAVRISIGLPTTLADIQRLMSFSAQLLNKTINSEKYSSHLYHDQIPV